MTRYRWINPRQISATSFSLTDSPLLCEITARRGFSTADAVHGFLSPDLATLSDPYLLPDMELAVARITDAIRCGRRIGIFGDYDVDGITSTAILKRTIDLLGGDAVTYLPHRLRDGYGLNANAIERMAADGVGLLVALDCGTSNAVEVAQAQVAGMQTVVVDHHHVSESQLPDTAFVSAQRRDSQFPYRDLAAVGVTYYLVRALIGDQLASSMLPLVALGTVADVVPLIGENRTLVSHGLRNFAADAVLGLQCLARSAGLNPQCISSYHCGYILGPRINAAGRIDEPGLALELLLTDDRCRADELAERLGKLNTERQQMVRSMLVQAEGIVQQQGDNMPFFVVGGVDWSVGLVGLVAGRLTERYHRPSLALSIGEEMTRGSARSIEGFNIVEALDECSDLLLEHGGHSQAAGLTMRTADLPKLEARLIELSAKAFGDTLPVKPAVVDAELHGRELTLDTAQLLTTLEPFGSGNPAPRFMIRAAKVRSPRCTRDAKHVQFDLETSDGTVARAIFFDGADSLPQLLSRGPFDLLFELKLNEWRGRTDLNVEVLDFRQSVPNVVG